MNHIEIRNENLFCSHCGDQHPIIYPIAIEDIHTLGDAFTERHAKCPKTWTEPTAERHKTTHRIMGSRADFYIRENGGMEYLGSKCNDGYPASWSWKRGVDVWIFRATTAKEFKELVTVHLSEYHADNVVMQNEGWKWPWEDSTTTDYSYIFEAGKVMYSYFGGPLTDPLIHPNQEQTTPELIGYFPKMR